MKRFEIILMLFILALQSCRKDKDLESKVCNYQPSGFSFANNTNTIIPINNQNFWLYNDSIRNDSTNLMVRQKDFLLTMENYYKVDNYNSISFNQLIPQLTIIGDTLFTTLWTPEATTPECFELHKYLFDVQDTTLTETGSNTILYRSVDTIHTNAGNYTNNIVYQTGEYFKMIINKNVGIIRIEFYPNGTTARRTLTLKNFEIY